jgi:Tol biopolymer transport system component
MHATVLCALLAAASPQAGGVSFQDKLLGTIEDDVSADLICFSFDGKQVAYRGLKGGKYAVWINKTKGSDFSNIDALCFNRDHKAVYRAAVAQSWQIFVGGAPVGSPMPFVGLPVFSPDGKKLAYEASRGQGVKFDKTAWTVYTAGAKGGDYHTTLPPTWSGDGSITGFKIRIGKEGTAERAFHTVNSIVVGGKVGPEYDECTGIFFASKGKRYAYKCRTGDVWSMVVDGKAEGGWATVTDPLWSPDGDHYLYIAAKGLETGTIIVDGKPAGEYAAPSFPVWASNSKDYAFVYRTPKGAVVRVGAQESTPYPEIGEPVFAPQGTDVAFSAKGKKAWTMVWSGRQATDDMTTIQKPVWSPDGKKVAYRAIWQFKWIVAIDDTKAEKFDQVGEPVWDPTSKKVAHAAQKDGKWFMVAGYRRGEAFDEVLSPPYWSSDGTKLAFGVRKGPDLIWRVIPVE